MLALVVLFTVNALEEAGRDGFGVVLPEIRSDFGLDLTGVLTLIAIVSLGALALQVPIAALADRTNRVRLMWIGALGWACFTLMTGLAPTLVLLAIARSGAGIGKAVLDPTHNSLLADYYDIDSRPRVFSAHRAGNAVGACLGPIFVGFVGHEYGWQVPFVLLAIPGFIVVLFALKMREPVRGAFERKAMGASEEAVLTEEPPPSFAESWRIVWKIESLRRIWYSLPFLAASLIGFASLASLLYDQVFGLDERARGLAIAVTEPAQIVGLDHRRAVRDQVDGHQGTRGGAAVPVDGRVRRDGRAGRLRAARRTSWIALIAHSVINATLAILAPGILATLSLAIPPRARSMGFSVASLWVVPGLLILPIIGALGDHLGLRVGMLALIPAFVIGGLVIATTSHVIANDIADVWRAAAARSEVAYERQPGPFAAAARAGTRRLLRHRAGAVRRRPRGRGRHMCRAARHERRGQVDVAQGDLRGGRGRPRRRDVRRPRDDARAAERDRRARHHAGAGRPGRVPVADGRGEPAHGVVAAAAGQGRDRARAWRTCSSCSRSCRERMHDSAGDLSGGQQQMLALSMAFLSTPKLLLIDELSLGLAPVVVAQLLPLIDELRAAGTTVVLVEQSVNVALSVADVAFFMEKGEIRFHGPTAELLDRPDILRSVFLSAGEITAPRRPPRRAATASSRAGDRPSPRRRRSRSRDLSCSFGGIRAVDRVSLEVVAGRDRRHHRARTARARRRCSTRSPGYVKPDAGQILLGARDITQPRQRGARQGRARSLVPGRPPVPVAHRRRGDLRRVRTVDRGPRSVERGAAPAELVRLRASHHAAGRRARRAARARGVPVEVRARAVDRHAPGRRPRVPARAPTRRSSCSTSRRAASRSGRRRRCRRCCCASATTRARASW